MRNLFRRSRLLVMAAFALAAVGLAAAQETSAPPAKEVKEAVDTLRDVYEKDYKDAEKDPKAKKALARKLYDGAAKRKTAAMQYASYDEARRLAAESGDARLALDSLTALTAKFKNVPPEVTADTLKMLGDAELTPADAAALIALASDGANAALEREDYAGAVAMAKLVVAAARKLEDPDRLLEAREFLKRAEALQTAVETIKTKPDDPEANDALGQYWTFSRARWDVGLKYLAKSSNKALADAAKLDLAKPKTAKDRTAAADAWYKLADDFKGAEHKQLIDRAWEWYSAALAVADPDKDEDLKPSERIKAIEAKYPELFDQTLNGHTAAVAGVTVSPDGRTLVSVGNDNAVRIWDAATGKFVKVLEGHSNWVGSVVVTPDGTKAITGGGDNSIRVWDLKTGKELLKLQGHTVAIRGLCVTADGKTLISGASDKTCRAWDLEKGTEIRKYGEEKASVESVAVTADGKYVLAGNDVGVITVFDAKTGDVVSKYENHGGTMVYTIVTTADGTTAISGARDKDIHVWDIATGKTLRKFKGHTEQVYQVALSADGKYLVSAGYDKTVRVWDFASGKELKKFEGHTDGIQGTCFTPDGRFVFSASWDKSIRKWRLPVFPAGGGNKKID